MTRLTTTAFVYHRPENGQITGHMLAKLFTIKVHHKNKRIGCLFIRFKVY
jgi:hypothetical protein